MNGPPTDPTPWLLFGIKVSTLLVSTIAAVLSVLLDIKGHSLTTALLAIASGIIVAIVCTEPIAAWIGIKGADHAIAGVLGIAGRNLIIWVAITSKDPWALVDRLRGIKK